MKNILLSLLTVACAISFANAVADSNGASASTSVNVALTIADPCLNSFHQTKVACAGHTVFKAKEQTQILRAVDVFKKVNSNQLQQYKVITTDYY